MTVLLDLAGGMIGGAGRWKRELGSFLAAGAAVTLLGRQRRLTSGWLVRREWRARQAHTVIAANNVSFAVAGQHRKVLVHNALHFAYPTEQPLLRRMPRSWHAQIPVVRAMLTRADTVVVPSVAMAERVQRYVPAVADRIAVRMQPLTPLPPGRSADPPFILVPLRPGPYRNLVSQLTILLEALWETGSELKVRVTARPGDLPAPLAGHPALDCLGYLSQDALARHWQTAAAVFYPSTLESFGYPLAEARASGLPVLAPDTPLAREVAGPALVPYDPLLPASLTAGLDQVGTRPAADPAPFDPDSYFRWLLDLPAAGTEPVGTPAAASLGAADVNG